MKRRAGSYKFGIVRISTQGNLDEFKDKWMQSVRTKSRGML